MPSYAIDGLILRGTVREVSTYARTKDQVPMLGLRVMVEGDEYRTVHQVSVPAAGLVMPAQGQTVEVECAVRTTRDGGQYLTGYDGGVTILDDDDDPRVK